MPFIWKSLSVLSVKLNYARTVQCCQREAQLYIIELR